MLVHLDSNNNDNSNNNTTNDNVYSAVIMTKVIARVLSVRSFYWWMLNTGGQVDVSDDFDHLFNVQLRVHVCCVGSELR